MQILNKAVNHFLQAGPIAFHHKTHEVLNRKVFNYLITKKKWHLSIKIGEKLLKRYPENTYYHLRLALCYERLNDMTRAYSLIEQGMRMNFNLQDAIHQIENKIGKKETIASKHVLLGGWNNLGCIIHKLESNVDDIQALTKITFGTSAERERQFYLDVYGHHAKLQEITPKLINILEVDSGKMSLITMEKIKGRVPVINDEEIEKAIKVSNIIATLNYNELIYCVPIRDNEIFENKFDLLRSFVSIHKESKNKAILNYIYQKMNEKEYTKKSIEKIKQLEKIVVKNKLHEKINREEHYSLQHGDFFNHNFLLEEKSKRLYLIDWGYMNIGPKCVDFAGFLGKLELPFDYVNEVYLSNERANGYLQPVEKIIFIYALIITWFIVLTPRDFDAKQDNFVTPAISLLEKLDQQLNNLTKSISTEVC